MIIGEATKRLEPEFKNKYTNIPWKKMAGMRDVLIHNYEEIDLQIPWNIIQNELPKIIEDIKKIIHQIDS